MKRANLSILRPSDMFRGGTLLSAFLVLLLVFSLIAASGCMHLPSTGSDTVRLLIKVPRTSHNVVFDGSITQIDQVLEKMAEEFEDSYDMADVDVEIEVFEQNQYDTAVVDCFDTQNAADILYGDYFNISTYIHTGRVIPLDDVVTDKIKGDVFDYLWDLSEVEGSYYMMPYLARQNVLAYSKELFSRAGLDAYIKDDEIQSWTLEEWTYILDTLSQQLSEAEFPMMMYANSSQGDTHIMTLLRSSGSQFFDDDGHFNISTPEGIAALKWIQDGVSRGWFPTHCENLEIEDCSSLFKSGQLAIYMVNNASIGRYGDTIGLVNFPDSSDEGCATTFVSGFEVFDNGDAQKVQIAKDFISFVYGNEDLMAYAAGALPASQKAAEEYGQDIPSFDLFFENRKNVVDFTGNNPDTLAVRDIFYKYIHNLLAGKVTPEEAAHQIDEDCNAVIEAAVAASELHE